LIVENQQASNGGNTIDLYRSGNANSPRMDNVRPKDVATYTDVPPELELVNDHDDHWLWKPSETMLLDEYKAALQLIGVSFYKVS
jgi:hypothetical protein